MGEPALQKYDDDKREGAPPSAYEKAKKEWGIDDETQDEQEGGTPDNVVSLDAARQRRADKKSGASTSELASDEASGAVPEATTAEKTEKADATAEGNEIPFRDEGKRKRRFFATTKQKVGGGIAAILIGGGFWGFSILQGPLQLIHIAQLLQNFHFASNNEASSSRIGRVYEYFRTTNDPSKRNLGFIGEKLSTKYIADLGRDGISIEFETPSGRSSSRIQSMTINPDHPKGQATIDRLRAAGIEVDGDGFVNMRGDGLSARQRRQALNAAVDLNGKGKISSAVTKRLLHLRAGVDFHPLRNIRRDANERWIDFVRDRRADRSERNSDGVDARAGAGDAEGESQQDPNNPEGDPIENPDASNAADNANDIARQAADADTPDLRRGLVGKIGGGAAAVIGVLCMVREIGEGIDGYQHANIVLPMLRMSMEFVAIGSQIQTGQDVNLDEMGALASTLHDEETGSAFMGARGMQAVSGEELTGPDTDVKPSDVGEKPAIFNTIGSIGILGTACGVLDSASRIPLIGGAIRQFQDWTGEALDVALRGATGMDTASIMERVFAIFAGDLVDTYAQGAALGNIAAIGGRLAANDAAIAAGGRAISGAEFFVLQNRYQDELNKEFREKSAYARLFDVKDDRSLLARAIISAPAVQDTDASLNTIARLPTNLVSMVSQSFGRLVPSVAAQSAESYDFGVDAYGFSAGELEDEGFADPYAIAVRVEPRLAELNDKYGACFANRVDPTSFRLIVGEPPTYETVRSQKCNDGSQDLLNYRYYILDTVTIRSSACFEGVDETSCNELGFGAGSAAPVPTGSADPGQDTSGMTCPIGTEDGGIHQDFGPGGVPTVKIRICGIPGAIPKERGVNASIAAQTLAMIEAMRAAGLSPTGNAFRSYETQQALRQANCPNPLTSPARACSPPTAKSGNSMHEVGLAIDFSNMCYPNATCSPGSNDRYDWLMTHAVTYGFKKLSTEAWHWSVTGN